ncbi:MAG: iron chaperone [Enterococcus sp.]
MGVITGYIQQAPIEQHGHLNEMYHLLKRLLPEAEEKLSYGMPTFYLGENLVHFAGAKKHLGFYPTPAGVSQFAEELTEYKTSKGAIQFPYNQELPKELITKIVHFRIQQAQERLKK